jgi:anti-sigma regulatory factor (Ser/Thr protein kinase)
VYDCLELEGDPERVAVARAFVRSRLESWEAADLIGDAEILASELVTNAVLHAHTQIRLTLTLDATTVRVEVFDADPRMPTMADCSPDATSGRGLAMVEALAASWGVEQRSNGKIVWAEIGKPKPTAPKAA